MYMLHVWFLYRSPGKYTCPCVFRMRAGLWLALCAGYSLALLVQGSPQEKHALLEELKRQLKGQREFLAAESTRVSRGSSIVPWS